MITRESIEEKMENLLEKGRYNKEEVGYITDYHLGVISKENKEKLDRLYLERIGDEREKIKEKLGTVENLDTLISFLSYSGNSEENILEELPIEKSLRVFEKIKNLYLLYTEETKENCEKVIDTIKKRYRRLKIQKIEVKINNINDIYLPLKERLMTEEIKSDNTIFDVTLGLKMTGIALYKLASERKIISINWKELQLPEYTYNEESGYTEKSRIKRVQLTTVLDIMKEPIVENQQNRILINSALERGEYLLTAGYYEKIGMENFAFFLRELDKIFSFEVMFLGDSTIFFENVGEFLENIFQYRRFDKVTIDRIKNFVTLLTVLYIDEIEKKPKGFEKNRLGVTEEDLDDKRDLLEKDSDKLYTNEIFLYLVLKFFYNRIATGNLNNSGLNAIKEDMNLDEEKIEVLKKAKSLEEIKEILFGEDLAGLEEELDILDIGKEFKEKVDSAITFNGKVLNIEKYGITVDFSSETEFLKDLNKKRGIPLLYLLSEKKSGDRYLKRDIFFFIVSGNKDYNLEEIEEERVELLNEKDGKIKILKVDLNGEYNYSELGEEENGYYRKEKNNTKKLIAKFNEIVARELVKNGREKKDFFILSKGLKEKVSLKINEDFYKIV